MKKQGLGFSFWAFLTAVALSRFSDLAVSFTVSLMAVDTGIPYYVTLALLSSLVPPIFVSAWAGRLVDKWDSVLVWRFALCLQCACYFAIFWTSQKFELVLILLCFANAVEALASVAAFKTLPRYTGRENLTRGSAYWTSVQTFAGIPSAPVAGLVYPLWGASGFLLANSLSFLLPLIVLFLLPPRGYIDTAAEAQSNTESKHTALSFLKAHRRLSLYLLLFIACVFASTIEGTAGIFYLRELSESDAQYGLILACWSLGIVGGAQLAGYTMESRDNRQKYPHRRLVSAPVAMACSSAVMGLAFVLTVLIPVALVIAFLFVMGGVGNGYKNLSLRTLIYDYVPTELQGAVVGLHRTGIYCAVALGNLTGTPNVLYGADAAVFASGLLLLLCALGLAMVVRRFR